MYSSMKALALQKCPQGAEEKSLRTALRLAHAVLVVIVVLPVIFVITELIRKSVIKEITTSERRFTHIGKVALLEVDLIYDCGLRIQLWLFRRQQGLQCLQNTRQTPHHKTLGQSHIQTLWSIVLSQSESGMSTSNASCI